MFVIFKISFLSLCGKEQLEFCKFTINWFNWAYRVVSLKFFPVSIDDDNFSSVALRQIKEHVSEFPPTTVVRTISKRDTRCRGNALYYRDP